MGILDGRPWSLLPFLTCILLNLASPMALSLWTCLSYPEAFPCALSMAASLFLSFWLPGILSYFFFGCQSVSFQLSSSSSSSLQVCHCLWPPFSSHHSPPGWFQVHWLVYQPLPPSSHFSHLLSLPLLLRVEAGMHCMCPHSRPTALLQGHQEPLYRTSPFAVPKEKLLSLLKAWAKYSSSMYTCSFSKLGMGPLMLLVDIVS